MRNAPGCREHNLFIFCAVNDSRKRISIARTQRGPRMKSTNNDLAVAFNKVKRIPWATHSTTRALATSIYFYFGMNGRILNLKSENSTLTSRNVYSRTDAFVFFFQFVLDSKERFLDIITLSNHHDVVH